LKRVEKNIIYAYGFEWGRTFIVRRELENHLYNILPNIATKPVSLFMAIRDLGNAPKNIKDAKVVWVTDIVGKDRIKPHNLTILTDSIIRFIEENENAIVLIDCVEYLLLYNDFINVLRNIELINSYIMEKNAMLIIITDNNSYTPKEYSLLRRYAIEWNGV
jgi:archaellum biogenesis ATPase FlaH